MLAGSQELCKLFNYMMNIITEQSNEIVNHQLSLKKSLDYTIIAMYYTCTTFFRKGQLQVKTYVERNITINYVTRKSTSIPSFFQKLFI